MYTGVSGGHKWTPLEGTNFIKLRLIKHKNGVKYTQWTLLWWKLSSSVVDSTPQDVVKGTDY